MRLLGDFPDKGYSFDFHSVLWYWQLRDRKDIRPRNNMCHYRFSSGRVDEENWNGTGESVQPLPVNRMSFMATLAVCHDNTSQLLISRLTWSGKISDMPPLVPNGRQMDSPWQRAATLVCNIIGSCSTMRPISFNHSWHFSNHWSFVTKMYPNSCILACIYWPDYVHNLHLIVYC